MQRLISLLLNPILHGMFALFLMYQLLPHQTSWLSNWVYILPIITAVIILLSDWSQARLGINTASPRWHVVAVEKKDTDIRLQAKDGLGRHLLFYKRDIWRHATDTPVTDRRVELWLNQALANTTNVSSSTK